MLHDVTRSAVFGQGGHNHVAAVWRDRLAPAFARLGHELVCPAAFAEDRPAAVERLADATGLTRDTAGWVRLYSDPALVPAVGSLLAAVEPADLVLGWELSPNIVRALARRGIAVIDMGVAPLRFAPDLYLRLRTSDSVLATRLAGLAVPDAVFAAAAARMRTAVGGQAAAGVVFVGQTDVDASLISDGALAGAAPHVATLRALMRPDEALLLKPHPHGVEHGDIDLLHRLFPNARIVTDSAYALLAAPAVRRVVTLSSSVAEEARWFGKTAFRLVTPDAAPERLGELSGFHLVGIEMLGEGFWARLLDGAAEAPQPPAGVTLRRLFSLGWGWPPLPVAPPPGPGPDGAIDLGAAARCGFGWQVGADGIGMTGRMATLRFARPHGAALTVTLEVQGGTMPGVELSARPGRVVGPLAVAVPAGPAGVVEIAVRAPRGTEIEAMRIAWEGRE